MKTEEKIDKIAEDIGEIKITMAVNTESLKEHIKRTNLLEKRVEPMWTSYKVIGFIISASFVLAAIAEIMRYFKELK